MVFRNIGFLGCGNMGGALAGACAKRTKHILLANRTPAKAEALAAELNCQAADNRAVAERCDLIFLGVKPQMMGALLAELAPVLSARQDRFVLVSMAAGLTIGTIRAMAGGNYPVIRIMPNTPAAIGEGMILYCAEGVETEEKTAFVDVMPVSYTHLVQLRRQRGLYDPQRQGLRAGAGCQPGGQRCGCYSEDRHGGH